MTVRHAIWFDFGGVLTPPVHETVAAFCSRVGATSEVLVSAMTVLAREFGTEDIMEPLDTPLLSEAEWAARMATIVEERFGKTVDLSDFGDKWFADRDANQELVKHMDRLRERGHFIGMLSNMVPSWNEHWRRMVPPEKFDDVVMSFEVATRKPKKSMYELAADRAGVPPAFCILVDDLPQNCAGAVAAGWSAVHYVNDNGKAIREIDQALAGLL